MYVKYFCKEEKSMLNSKLSASKKIAFSAIFASLCCVATFIQVPLPFGYFNLGDIFVLVGAWSLGPVLGALAAGIGSALADLLLGYSAYIPATFVIKAAMAVCAYFLYELFKKIAKGKKLDVLFHVTSAVVAECVMVGGYLLYEAFILGYGAGALASVSGNCLQGAAAIIGASILISVLPKIEKLLRN
ncbi:MAG: ECF transporter S component [Ruminococcaceae bacterium]|nr:ECF transporter S component [Oscillospiraceae bacterium]